jgi:hypothetical protein
VTAAPLALRDQLLAVLRDADGFPLSTQQVAVDAGLARCDPAAWRHLDALARAGKVERIRIPGHYSVYWRAAGWEPVAP